MVYLGSKISPLLAESVEVVDLLRPTLLASTLQRTKVALEIPEPNQASIELARRLGLTKLWKTFHVVYSGSIPKIPLEHI